MNWCSTTSPPVRRAARWTAAWINRVAEFSISRSAWPAASAASRDAEEVLNFGADKISINTPALANPGLITELARRFGSQCVVVGIDSREEERQLSRLPEHRRPRPDTALRPRNRSDWVREVQDRGAGEIVLNCMNQDGVRQRL